MYSLLHLKIRGGVLTLACWAMLLASGFSASLRPDIYGDYDKASRDAKTSETWLRVWRTQIYTQLQSLQRERALQPLHIYMNGDSSFRQQKNFLCSILQPGFERRGGPCWAVDTNCLLQERESSCYNSDLHIRVTYIDNSCCSVERLSYLANATTPPKPVYPPLQPPGDAGSQQGKGHKVGHTAKGDTVQKTRSLAQGAVGQDINEAVAAVAEEAAAAAVAAAAAGAGEDIYFGAHISALDNPSSKPVPNTNAGGHRAAADSMPPSTRNPHRSDRAGGATAAGPLRRAPAWAPGGPDNTTVVAYLNCGLHLYHLGATREFECLVEQVEYERVVQRLSLEAARLYPGAPHIWMTSTYVCDQNFVGDYGEAVRKIRTDPDAAVAACVQATGTPDKSGRYANDTAARERACRDGFFTSKNSKLLRDRMVSALQDERVHSVASLGLVDAFALTEGQCWASQMHDGRHYQMLVPAVVMDLVGALRRRLLPRVHEPRGGHEARGGHEPRGGRRGRPVTRGHAPAATTDGRRT